MHDTLRSSTARLRLHYNPFSSSARRTVMVVHHLKLPVELVLVSNLRDPEQRSKLTALNPNAKIPVLEHGIFALWESNAIMQYLADQLPEQTLYPTELRARADVNRWLFWCAQHWSPALGVLTWENWMKAMFKAGERDAREAARGEREFLTFGKVLDEHLSIRQAWVSGDDVTIADFSLATPLMRCREASVPLSKFRHVEAWLGRVQELDAWKQTEP